ncbi:MAG: hypothetical protein BWY21_00614 [Parcubacteria group bacterium ADurb.Bin216]|nr:MAG: hypothetical protein BWY21_00614 [Parcubacteria group bacterium ADurb.Bin216]
MPIYVKGEGFLPRFRKKKQEKQVLVSNIKEKRKIPKERD